MIGILNKYKCLFILLCIIILIIYLIVKGVGKMEANLVVTSSAFKNGGTIPIKYTGRGEDISVPLEFSNIVSSGKSIAIIMDDPDAPSLTPFVHWLIWDIPTTITKIPENVPNDSKIVSLGGAIQGKNGFGSVGYMGPNPPSGMHTYRIKVYVLDCFLNLKEGSPRETLEREMKGHVIQSGLLEGKFSH